MFTKRDKKDQKSYGSAAKNITTTANNSQGTRLWRVVQKNHCEYIDCLLYGV